MIDHIPPRLLGGEIIWAGTDVGPLVLQTADHGARELLLFGHQLHESEETEIARALLPSARGMLDIGAQYGWYSRLAANLMQSQALIIALEANPDVAACLQQALAGTPGVQVMNIAATDRARRVHFYCAKRSQLSSSVRVVGVPTEVDGLPVDDVWPTDQPLDFVKCDVEGGEWDVLRGARGIRKTWQPVWMLEFDESFLAEAGHDPAQVADEVSDMLCWWRSEKNGWVMAENLGAIVGKVRVDPNVYLVPRERMCHFGELIGNAVYNSKN